jgi:mono/diheme cytochrome c family protein
MRQRRGIVMLFGPALLFGLALLPSPAAVAAENPAPTLKKDVQPIFDRACADCHGVKRQKEKLNLSAATAIKTLVNVPANEVPQLVRVKPGDLDNSYLWQKLQNKAAKGKGMPRGIFTTKRLPEAELDVIRKWIEAGAPE